MTDEQKALSRRAVACKGWRWMPGMAVTFPDGMANRVALVTVGNYGYGAEATPTWMAERMIGSSSCIQWREHEMAPDLSDPATLGCLLALVREAWRCPTVYVRQSTTRRVSDGVVAWEVCDLFLDAEACRALGVPREGSVGCWGYASEAEALVAALESAP
jgi:hypothetical protein